jgi:phosphoglycerate dehydrogenase-like enzyme
LQDKIILLSNNYSQEPLKVVLEEVPDGFRLESLEQLSKAELLSKIPHADYLLVSGRLAIDRDVVSAANKLKMIQRTGVGVDTMDIATISERGIPVYVNFGVNADSVAEHTVLFIMAAARNLITVDKGMRTGVWQKNETGLKNRELSELCVGLVGLGRIGQKVCRILKSFGAKVLYYDSSRRDNSLERDLGTSYCDMLSLLAQSDVLSLHCPLNEDTKWLIGEHEISIMKPGSIIVNTARGSLIKEEALIDNLNSGHLSYACLDVFEQEPLRADSELLKMQNVILTPHIGGLTISSFRKMIRSAVTNIYHYDRGNHELISSQLFGAS